MYRSSPFSLFRYVSVLSKYIDLNHLVPPTSAFPLSSKLPNVILSLAARSTGRMLSFHDLIFLFFMRHQLPPRSKIIDPLSESSAHKATQDVLRFFHVITSAKPSILEVAIALGHSVHP